MGRSILYALNNLVLELDSAETRGEDLDRLLRELSWVRVANSTYNPPLYFSVSSNKDGFRIPRNCREVLRTADFRGLEAGDDFYLTDGSSVFHLRPAAGEGYARLTPSFFTKPALAQANFWCFGLLKLLRPLGIYSLHAAGLATQDGVGILLVGASGSGKSTLAIGLIRQGWRYLSDDAVLLRLGSQGVEALACRRAFYIDAARSNHYLDLPLGDNIPDSHGSSRRRINIDQAYPEQCVTQCVPRVMIFPKIESRNQSTLRRIDSVRALHSLLAQSAPQLFDRSTMERHLELLKRLLRQSEMYELSAGIDLYQRPAKLVDLIQEAQGKKEWRASLSS